VNKEEQIREARTIEAVRKSYMGLEGKFALIAKNLGHSIIQQGSSSFEQTFLEDAFEFQDENEIPIMDEDEKSYEIGMHFDALSRGYNLTISVMHFMREIVCRYEGKVVYKEISGELEGYVPNEDWEKIIDELTGISKKIEIKKRPIEREKAKVSNEKRKNEILDYLRNKWGL